MSLVVGTINATWTSPDGVVWPLSSTDDTGWFTTRQIAGWGATPVTITSDPLAVGGEQVRHIRANPRRLTWPLHVWGDTHQEFIDRYRALMRAFTRTTQLATPGILRVTRPNGLAREIEAYYENGWGGEGGENWVSANPVLTLYCPDGYWRDIQETVVTRSAVQGTPYLANYPRVSSSQVLGESTIDNPGEVDAWPVWTITGPASSITAINHTLDASFTLTYDLAEGEVITIITKRFAVRGPLDQNLADSLDWPAATLWPLVPGENLVEFVVGGAAPATEIKLAFVLRYEAA